MFLAKKQCYMNSLSCRGYPLQRPTVIGHNRNPFLWPSCNNYQLYCLSNAATKSDEGPCYRKKRSIITVLLFYRTKETPPNIGEKKNKRQRERSTHFFLVLFGHLFVDNQFRLRHIVFGAVLDD